MYLHWNLKLIYIYTFSVNSSPPSPLPPPPLHTISLQCSKERNNVDIPRLLVFLSRLTTCPPMVYALKLLYENSYLKLPCWVRICMCVAFLYAVKWQLVYSFFINYLNYGLWQANLTLDRTYGRYSRWLKLLQVKGHVFTSPDLLTPMQCVLA